MRYWVLAAMLCVAATANAQVFTGRIDVTAQDSTGAVLPGVTVDISGPQKQTAVTDAQGQVHFLNLPAGTYQVKASLQGFADYLNRTLPVSAGSAVPLRITLGVQGVSEQVQVSGEAPILDPNRQAISTNVTNQELQNIPSARDPWVVLQTIPGVIVDRVNVGGSESGQQSNYVAKGATTGDNTWYMDGIPITDMSALGSSPSYYDFDMFQEMQVTTGGSDARQATPGVQMNFVLKSGTNTPHGSARTYYENKDLQGNNLPDDLKEDLGGVSGKGNRLTKYADYGGELGGPLMKDRVWAWGSYGRTDVDIQTLDGFPDKTTLEDIGAKTAGGVHAGRARQLHLLQRQQEEGRPRRRPVQPARDDLHPGRALEDVQGGDQLGRVEHAVPDGARRARQRAVHAHAEGGPRQRPGLHRHRRRVPQQQLVQRQRSAAGGLQRRRQLVPRQARGPVRRVDAELQGRPDHALRRRLPRHPARRRGDDAGDSDPSVSPGQSRALLVALRRRHLSRWIG